jgi:hypothetical protein
MKEIETPKIDVFKPVMIRVKVSGRARREDGKYAINWFDRTIKVIEQPDFEYSGMDFMKALQEVTALYQLNRDSILKITLRTI